jgi:DNA-binding SARP family transcriptional activator
MIRRVRILLTGLTALVALAAGVVGLPVVLYRFGGSPLPRHLASWHHIASVLTSRDNGTLLLGVIRDCSWLAWLLFTVAVLAEVQAAFRGRSAPRLRLGGLQGGAAKLVALAALTFAAPPAVTLTASAAAVAPAHPDQLPGGAAVLSARTDALDVSTAARLVTVRPGDCLWSIAQHYLGAGDLYPEIANMNYGHDMGNGQVFTNPSLIQPGWRLAVPAASQEAGAAADSLGPAPGARHHAGHPSRDPHFQRRHASADHRLPASTSPAAASPAPASPAPASPAPASGAAASPAGASPAAGRGTANPAGVGSQANDPAGYQTSADVAGGSAQHLPEAAVFAAGALAGAVLTSLGRLRRRQRQFRRRGRRIALPADPQALAAEQRLHAVISSEPLTTLQDALLCLESGIAATGQVLPDIVGLHVTPTMLEVLLAAPAPDSPPPPYEITPGRQGMCWQLPLPAAAAGTGVPAADASGLLPGLFTAGATEAGYLLLDLESLQVTGCDGPAELIDQVVTAAATELATGQWSGWYDLILVGFGELEALGRAEHCATLDEALDRLDERCTAIIRRLVDHPPADLRQLRLAAPDDEDWGLTILVSRSEPTADQLAHLLGLAEDGPGGIAALVAGDPETPDGRMAPTVLQLAPDLRHPGEIAANVIPLQITVRPQTLSAEQYSAIGSLFAAAAETEDVGPEEQPYALYGAPPWIPSATAMRPGAESEYERQWVDDEPAEPDGAVEFAPADADGAGPTWHDAGEFATAARPPPQPTADPQNGWPPPQPTADPQNGWPPPQPTADSQNGWPPPQPTADPQSGWPLPRTTPPDGVPAPPWVTGGHAAAAPAGPRKLQISILGPFLITGAVEQLQPKQAELVLALALAAPGGLTISALCSMLGADPDHPKPSDAVRQIITRARRRLGRASDGREYIIHAGNGSYLLHEDASLDWTEFRGLLSSSRAEDMRAALGLVRGEPFTGSYHWWIDIPLLETVRAEIVDAAETLGEFELATGSPRGAARAARAGLNAEVSAEQLWRLLIRAEHAAGNPSGVAEAWRHCLDAIEDIAPGGEPHPDTEALYRRLSVTHRQHAPAGN